jgi:hypothetical protein
MKKLQLIVVLSLLMISVKGHCVPVTLNGIVHVLGDESDFIENANVLIIKDLDTLYKLKTDENGEFILNANLIVGDEVTIEVSRAYFVNNALKYKVTESQSVSLELSLIELKINKSNYPIFELNEIETFSGFNVELFKHQTRGLNNYYVKFTHFRNVRENDKITVLRMNYFKEFLIASGVPIENMKFDLNSEILNCDPNAVCRSSIQGEIVSIEKVCE